jgi:hypothetical protein
VTSFRASLNSSAYMHAAASWAEQRFFNELAVLSLEEAGHSLAPAARAELDVIENVAVPDPTGCAPPPPPPPPSILCFNTLLLLYLF